MAPRRLLNRLTPLGNLSKWISGLLGQVSDAFASAEDWHGLKQVS